MSSGPVHNGGAFFLANGAATEMRAPHLRCRGGAGDGAYRRSGPNPYAHASS